jgi:hypothetical protein
MWTDSTLETPGSLAKARLSRWAEVAPSPPQKQAKHSACAVTTPRTSQYPGTPPRPTSF